MSKQIEFNGIKFTSEEVKNAIQSIERDIVIKRRLVLEASPTMSALHAAQLPDLVAKVAQLKELVK